MILIIFGLPGSGKSFFAKNIAERLNANYYNSDMIRREIFPARTYSEQEKEKVYLKMLEKAKSDLEENKNVVLDSTFYKESYRIAFSTKLVKYKPKWILIEADENVIKKRTESKRVDSEADFSVYLKIKKEFEPVNFRHLKLKSEESNLEQMIQIALIDISYEQGGN